MRARILAKRPSGFAVPPIRALPKLNTIWGSCTTTGKACQDYVLSHQWLNLAAAQFGGDKEEQRALTVKARDQAAKKLKQDELAEAQRLAREWKPKSEYPY